MYCTNLSVLYVNRRRGNRAENLREAERLLEAALRVRSIERDPVDWAYTATNLAHASLREHGSATAPHRTCWNAHSC